MTSGDKPPILPTVVTLVFAALTSFTWLHHELWRDELQAWLIARDCTSLRHFFHIMRYEGTPPLWHAVLLIPSHLGLSPLFMQLLHGMLGVVWVYLICRYSPFPARIKIFLSFSYYVFYQYTVIARNYTLGLLLLTLACIYFSQHENRPWRVGIALGLAALTSVHALIVAAGLAFASRNRRVILLYTLGAVGAVTCMIPAADALFPSSPGWFTHFHLLRLLETTQIIVKGFLPTPEPSLHFWENPWIAHIPYFVWLSFPLAVGILFAAGWAVSQNREAKTAYWVATFGLAAFYYVKYLGYSRHHGFLFFSFIFALWLAWESEQARRVTHVLTALLVFQSLGTVVAAYYDIRHPFSCGKDTARYIRATGLENHLLVAGPDYSGVPVVGYLNVPFYAPQGDRSQTFTLWDRRRIEMLNDREFIRRARAEGLRVGKEPLLLFNAPLSSTVALEDQVQLVRSEAGSIAGDEDYYLYKSSPARR